MLKYFTKKNISYFIGTLATVALVGFGIFFVIKNSKPQSLQDFLKSYGNSGSEVLKNMDSMNVVAPSKTNDGFEVVDDSQSGIQIQFANQQENKDDQPKEQTKVQFPKTLDKPLNVNLPGGKTITITDKNASSMGGASLVALNSPTAQTTNNNQIPKINNQTQNPANLVQYKSNDGRKTIVYGYQKDGATGEKKLKNWIMYAKGSGTENESYAIANAKVKIDQDGNVNVFFDDGKDAQNQKAIADVPQSLIDRAQKAIAADMGGDILNPNKAPNFTIPHPYYFDKDGNLTELKWNLDESSNTISVKVEAKADQYPLALDPTLSFTVPGQSNTGAVITGEASSQLGTSILAGDFNGDGRMDLAVGASAYDPGGAANTGRVYVFYNKGATAPSSATNADVILTGGVWSNFGYSMTTGDFNGDGKTDLAVGAIEYPGGGTGRVYIFYGGSTTVSKNASAANVVITGQNAGDEIGFSLTSGDFNADGKTDLAIGAPIYSSNYGRVYIIYGSSSLSATIAAATQSSVIINNTSGSINLFGSSLVAGDFNGDGRADLLVGMPGYNGGAGNGGAVMFYTSGATQFGTAACSGAPVPICLAANLNLLFLSGGTGRALGTSLVAGDFNGDGKTDFAIGGPSAYGGVVDVVYDVNGAYGSTGCTAACNLISMASIALTGEATGDAFGTSMSVGDFNGDGKTDLAVGANAYSGGANTGRTYIFYQGSKLVSGVAFTSDVIITGEATSQFGLSMTAGDFNGDGKTDLAVGASTYNSSQGRAYIFYSQNGQINTNKKIAGSGSDNLGSSMAAADFNGDGRADLAVSSQSSNRAYVFYNDGTIPATSATADVIINGEAASAFGYSMAVGDFNSDGKIELAVGAAGLATYYGRVSIFTYNSSNGYFGTSCSGSPLICSYTGANTTLDGVAGSYFGTYMVAGDFDADGKTDLAVGAGTSSVTNSSVSVFFQGSKLVAGESGAGTADVIINGDISSYTGTALAVGDFNGDGKTDLAIGAENVAKSYTFYGKVRASWTTPLATASNADVIITGTSGSYFGSSMIGGDFNGDGKIDLAISASSFNPGGAANTGQAYIFYNSSTATKVANQFGTTTCSGTPAACTASNADILITGEAATNQFGFSMTAGDFNADGKTDLAVGANWYASYAGRAYIFYQGSRLVTANASTADITITGDATNNYFGSFMTSGDLNTDGKIDLIIGATGASPNGGAYIYETRNNYAWVMPKIPLLSTRISGSAGQEDTIVGQASSNVGTSMVTGDFNGDGKTDLAVGSIGYNPGGASSTGRVYIFYNDGSLSTTATSADVIITGEAGSRFGSSMTSGDFNGDGKTDLAVGATSIFGNAGRVYVLYQGAYFATGTVNAGNLVSPNITILTGEALSQFGYSMTSGDFNGDGKTDLAVGAYIYSTNAGRVYVFYQGAYFATGTVNAGNLVSPNITILTGEAVSNFGYAMTSGDFNGDGKTDLAVGANIASSNAGRVYVFYQNSTLVTGNSTSASVIFTGEAAKKLGYSLVAGDFNGDGKTDLAMGSQLASSTAGSVYVVYQGAYFATGTVNAGSLVSPNITILTGEVQSYFGSSLTAGDFNGDGKTDLAVGAYYYPSSTSTGRAYIFNQSSKLATNNASTADAIITGETAGDQFGFSMTSGDMNGDGKTDLIVSANQYKTNYGKVYIYSGAPAAIAGGAAADQFGYAMTAGDFNADGKVDLAVGAPGANSGVGRVYVFYNRGNSVAPNIANADVIFNDNASNVAMGTGLASGDLNGDGKTDLIVGEPGGGSSTAALVFYGGSANMATTNTAHLNASVAFTGGNSVGFASNFAAGDFNGDGISDLAIGGFTYGATNKGDVYIISGSRSLAASAAVTTAAFAHIAGETNNDMVGLALTAGDFNNDGKSDLALGSTAFSTISANAGRVYVFTNVASLLGVIPASLAGIKIDGESGSKFGYSLASSDFNADGKTDLAVGANIYNSSAGRVYVFNQGSTLATGNATSASTIITGQNASDQFGSSLVSGDFNQDGKTDLAVGAQGFSSNIGRAYVFYNNNGALQSDSTNPGATIDGTVTNGYFGTVLLSADFSRDGIMDLVVAADGTNSVPTGVAVGNVYVYPFQSGPTFQPPVSSRGTFKSRGTMKIQ